MNRLFVSCYSAVLHLCPLSSFLFRKTPSPPPDEPYDVVAVKKPTIVINSLESIPSVRSQDGRKVSSASVRSVGDTHVARANFSTQYISAKKTLIVKIKDCSELDLECFDSDCTTQMRLFVPCAVKNQKQQTAFAAGFQPLFDEAFVFTNVELSEVASCRFRLRLYTKKGRSKPELKGESEFKGKLVLIDAPPQLHSLKLESLRQKNEEVDEAALSPMLHRGSTSRSGDSRRSSMVDACGRFCSQPNNDSAELLVSLCYYADHGRLIVGVERGSLPQRDGDTAKAPDTCVKVIAQSEYGSEIGKQKTETVKASAEPRYDCHASFQIPQCELENTSVVLQVWTWTGVLRRRSQIGWFSLGLNSSSPDAQEHWHQMIQGLGTTVSKWHPILPPE